MTTSKAGMNKVVINLVRETRNRALDRYQRAMCDLAAAEAAKKVWVQQNPDDGVGGMSSCPYHPEREEKTMESAKFNYETLEETLTYVVEQR